jgi:hypothetical protein
VFLLNGYYEGKLELVSFGSDVFLPRAGPTMRNFEDIVAVLLQMDRYGRALLFVLLLAARADSGVAWAEQAPPSTQQCPEDDAKRPPRTDNPSDQLADTKGIVCPPAGVDPAIEIKPPSTDGAIKVIPAPGTPGGNPEEQPK